MTIRIGDLTISGRVLAAPFSGISNMPFRMLARQHGAGLVFTEMVKARPWVDGTMRKTRHMITFDESERPVFAQIATGDPIEAERVTRLVFEAGFDGIDLNMGCPVKKISKSKCGAYLLGHPELVSDIVGAMERTAASLRTPDRPFPVTVKTRAGLTSENVNGIEIGQRAEDAGAAAITIHARTKDQHHSGGTKTEVVAQLKQTVRIPVFFNGSVNSPDIAARVTAETGCDGVMIGRASFGNPWIFGRVQQMLTDGHYDRTAPTLGDVADTMRWHFGVLRKLFGDFHACLMIRRYGCWYIKGVHSSAAFRKEMHTLDHPGKFDELIARAFEGWPADQPAPLADFYDADVLSDDPDAVRELVEE